MTVPVMELTGEFEKLGEVEGDTVSELVIVPHVVKVGWAEELAQPEVVTVTELVLVMTVEGVETTLPPTVDA